MKENNNGNDTNVGSIGNSIKEDIIILEQLIIANENCIKNTKMKDNPFVAIWEKQNRALEHILSDYKRVLKENQDLRESNRKLYEIGKEMCKQDKYTSKNYIPVQKVKDKIEEIQKEYSNLDQQVDEYIKDVNKNLSKYYESKEKIAIMQTLACFVDKLQELLEERK